ncbi:MAG: ShlB/FhaC/HecB family hemolysin secretion/activation protein [Alphaproteobacteria bacterium]|nr:ShlB/FhaC/HecB family hemolysin secretion/activation protein [Alphaproteobacteria bacterium]
MRTRLITAVAIGLAALSGAAAPALAQSIAPSQVAPPVIPAAPPARTRIALPQVIAGQQIPAQAKQLKFVLTGLDIEGEFEELVATRKELSAPLIGKRITVADLFEFADKLQQAYVRAGYPLVRVVTLPQELEKSARVKLRVIDGYIERIDSSALNAMAQGRVTAVVGPLLKQRHLTQAELERRLLLAGETPGVVLNAVFAAGKEIGGSVLVLTGRYRPFSASVYVDDAMPKTFGTVQAVTTFAVNNLAGFGEQIQVSAAGYPSSDFTSALPTRRYLSALATVPIGIDGLKLELYGVDGKTTPRVDNPLAATFGLLDQMRVRLLYPVIKRRDSELTLQARYEATDERIDTLAITPVTPLSLDRTRALRAGFDGIWRGRETGTTLNYGALLSQGLDAFGARTAADAAAALPFLVLPLSRQGADAVFTKLTAYGEIIQAIPQTDFVATLYASGQDSFRKPMLTSEQFDLAGTKQLSGFAIGTFPGDSAWVVRGELQRPWSVPLANVNGTILLTPYLFGAHGERILWAPTALEFGSVHVSNYGIGMRFNLPGFADYMPDSYAFVEASNGYTNLAVLPATQHSSRIFAGLLLQY